MVKPLKTYSKGQALMRKRKSSSKMAESKYFHVRLEKKKWRPIINAMIELSQGNILNPTAAVKTSLFSNAAFLFKSDCDLGCMTPLDFLIKARKITPAKEYVRFFGEFNYFEKLGGDHLWKVPPKECNKLKKKLSKVNNH